MAHHPVLNRVLESSTTSGTGAYALAGAVAGFRTFAGGGVANGDTVAYYAEAVDANGAPVSEGWEAGIGTWSTGGTLARTVVIESSNANAAVNWSGANALRIGCGLLASTVRQREESISPSAQQNDLVVGAETGLLRVTPTTSVVITGIAGGVAGRRLTVLNASTDKLLVLAHANASSSSGNRFDVSYGGANKVQPVLVPGDSLDLIYDAASAAWRVTKMPAGGVTTNWVTRSLVSLGSSGTYSATGITGAGTVAAVTPSAGGYLSQAVRGRVTTTGTAGATQRVGMTGPYLNAGDAAGIAGFVITMLWGGSINPANAGACFHGFRDSNAAIGNVNPSTLLNCIGFSTDAGESTLRLNKNDGAGTCTRQDLGANYPWNTTACYEGQIYRLPGSGSWCWVIWRTDDMTVTPVAGYETTDVPPSTPGTLYTAQQWVGNRAAAAAYAFDWMGLFVQTPQ